jgi:polysaccharide biosynthesis/export protein
MAAVLASACGVSSVNEGGPEPKFAALADTAKPAGSSASAAPAGRDGVLLQVSNTYAPMSDPKSKSYKIGPRDVLDVTVFKVPELTKSVQVSEAGTINFPLVGEMNAGGKTAREVEQDLTKALGAKYLKNPQVTVFVKEHNSQRITVEGAVKKPGIVPMAGGMSLLQAVAQSGGLDEVADSDVAVFRTVNGKRSAIRYDISAIRSGKAEDPQLEPEDLVVVPTSDLKQGFNTFLKLVPLATIVPLL